MRQGKPVRGNKIVDCRSFDAETDPYEQMCPVGARQRSSSALPRSIYSKRKHNRLLRRTTRSHLALSYKPRL